MNEYGGDHTVHEVPPIAPPMDLLSTPEVKADASAEPIPEAPLQSSMPVETVSGSDIHAVKTQVEQRGEGKLISGALSDSGLDADALKSATGAQLKTELGPQAATDANASESAPDVAGIRTDQGVEAIQADIAYARREYQTDVASEASEKSDKAARMSPPGDGVSLGSDVSDASLQVNADDPQFAVFNMMNGQAAKDFDSELITEDSRPDDFVQVQKDAVGAEQMEKMESTEKTAQLTEDLNHVLENRIDDASANTSMSHDIPVTFQGGNLLIGECGITPSGTETSIGMPSFDQTVSNPRTADVHGHPDPTVLAAVSAALVKNAFFKPKENGRE